ncbi:MAG: hypothetical protein AB1627_00980 [Chloroflexota bacterium]
MSARTSRFLGARKSSTPEAFGRHATRLLADWQEHRIRTALGMEFRQTSRVLIARPWWMPGWLFRRLMRSVLIETKDVGAR